MNVLEVKGLSAGFKGNGGKTFGYPDIFLPKGECLCVKGPIGCGKTTLLNALFSVSFTGTVTYEKADLLGMDINAWGRKKYSVLSFMPQYSQNALNPYVTIDKHIKHIQKGNKNTEHDIDLLRQLELHSSVKSMYPHQLSGGMKQRVVMLLGFLKKPQLFVIDEPSTAIDPVTLKVMLDLIKLKKSEGVSLILVTHDEALSEHVSDRTIDLIERDADE